MFVEEWKIKYHDHRKLRGFLKNVFQDHNKLIYCMKHLVPIVQNALGKSMKIKDQIIRECNNSQWVIKIQDYRKSYNVIRKSSLKS